MWGRGMHGRTSQKFIATALPSEVSALCLYRRFAMQVFDLVMIRILEDECVH